MSAADFPIARALLRSWHHPTSLLVGEIERTHVTKPGAKLRPFCANRGFQGAPHGSAPQSLRLTGWRLAHAVVKGDFLNPQPCPWIHAAGFVLGVATTLDWRQAELRLCAGASRSRADFAGTSLAGRIGQGVALLVMDLRGYAYDAHYPRAPGKQGPDFIVQNGATGALVEAKGRFVAPGQSPEIKKALNDGLKQLAACNAPGVTKSFVVATFLREVGDGCPEPSLVALVDPDIGDAESDDSPDRVIRENYAGWLRAMGLDSIASDLRARTRRERRGPVVMWKRRVAGAEFLLIPVPWPIPPIGQTQLWPWKCYLQKNARYVVLGLARKIVDRLQHALQNPSSALGDFRSTDQEGEPVSGPIEDDGFYGSVLRDGSLMGIIRGDSLFKKECYEEIEL